MPEPKTRPRAIPPGIGQAAKPTVETLDKRVTILETWKEQTDNEISGIKDIQAKGRNLLLGTPEEVGMLERMRYLEKDMTAIKRIAYAILVVLLGIVTTQLYYIIQSHPLP